MYAAIQPQLAVLEYIELKRNKICKKMIDENEFLSYTCKSEHMERYSSGEEA